MVEGTQYAPPAPAVRDRDAPAVPRAMAVRPGPGAFLLAADVGALVLGGTVARVPPLVGALFLVVVLIAYQAGRLYRPRLGLSLLDDLPALLGRALATTGAVLLGCAVVRPGAPIRPLIGAVGLGVVLLLLMRGAAYAAIRQARRRGVWAHRAIVVGDDDLGRRLTEEMGHHPEYGLYPVGYLGSGAGDIPGGAPLLGRADDLARVVREHAISVVVLAVTSRPDRDLVFYVRACGRLRCDIYWVPRLFELSPFLPGMDLLWGYPLVGLRREVFGSFRRAFQRPLDVLVAALALVLALPVMLVHAAAVRLDSVPVLFRRRRLDAGVSPSAAARLRALPGPQDRQEGFGPLPRASSLEDLPEPVNVLRADVSLCGPRPDGPTVSVEFGDRHPDQLDRHRVRDDLTGWSQIHRLRGPASVDDQVGSDNQWSSS